MRTAVCLAVAAAAALAGAPAAYSGGTEAEWIRFVQYTDENTALEEVRSGTLDMYYSRIPSDRIGSAQSREGLRVYDSTGGSYSILVNPAESDRLNPFSDRDARFALNYLVDRNLIVNELMGGYGVPMASNYGPFDPEYLAILGQLEGFGFRHDPGLADRMISGAMRAAGAERTGGAWTHGGEPVVLTVFIRSDDPVRRSIGEILAAELEGIGFEVAREYGDLNKAFVVVYGSDPAEHRWSLYTEGWGGRSAFVRYDPVGLAQMYSPWFSNMPGFNNPGYWNYRNDLLDGLTQRIYSGDFASEEERDGLIREATEEAVGESVRVFLASKVDQYVVNSNVDGVVNDLAAGIPSRFTPINARGAGEGLTIGVKQIYQGAWNPVRGLTDSYSTHVWNPVSDPAVFKHPFTGRAIPVRAQWDVETGGPGGAVPVPDGAVIWDPALQRWRSAAGSEAVSKVTFDLELGSWHHGAAMDMYDVLYSVYFALEWGTAVDGDDRTVDSEYTPQASQVASTLVGVRPVGDSRVEVYVDYWHFDEAEIAVWAAAWGSMPWEIYAAMERAVLDGRASFSRSEAVGKGVGWLSLIVPDDAHMIRRNLEEFREGGLVPAALEGFGLGHGYHLDRYGAAIDWINERDHAVISNGPFYLESYAPEARTITLSSFDDPGYPFGRGHWSGFEDAAFPEITAVDIPRTVTGEGGIEFGIETANASEVRYFVSNGDGMTESRASGTGSVRITIPEEAVREGTNSIRIFAVSEDVLRPDYYETSFVVAGGAPPGEARVERDGRGGEPDAMWVYGAAVLAAAAGAAVLLWRLRQAVA